MLNLIYTVLAWFSIVDQHYFSLIAFARHKKIRVEKKKKVQTNDNVKLLEVIFNTLKNDKETNHVC